MCFLENPIEWIKNTWNMLRVAWDIFYDILILFEKKIE